MLIDNYYIKQIGNASFYNELNSIPADNNGLLTGVNVLPITDELLLTGVDVSLITDDLLLTGVNNLSITVDLSPSGFYDLPITVDSSLTGIDDFLITDVSLLTGVDVSPITDDSLLTGINNLLIDFNLFNVDSGPAVNKSVTFTSITHSLHYALCPLRIVNYQNFNERFILRTNCRTKYR